MITFSQPWSLSVNFHPIIQEIKLTIILKISSTWLQINLNQPSKSLFILSQTLKENDLGF